MLTLGFKKNVIATLHLAFFPLKKTICNLSIANQIANKLMFKKSKEEL